MLTWLLKSHLRFWTLLFICLSVHGESENVFRGRIIDAETGEPVAATVSVLDEHGQEIAPEGDLDHVTYLGKKRWYSNGEFSVHTSKDNLFLEIRRGLETIPVQESVSFINSQSVSKTYELVAWTDMTKKGYMSADVHTHFQRLESTLKQMQAENLQVVNILIRDSNDDVDLFTGSVDPISTDEYFIYVGQEYRDMQMGHVNFMNPKSLVEPIDAVGGSHLHVGGNPPPFTVLFHPN